MWYNTHNSLPIANLTHCLIPLMNSSEVILQRYLFESVSVDIVEMVRSISELVTQLDFLDVMEVRVDSKNVSSQ
jgi:hypothetical protein